MAWRCACVIEARQLYILTAVALDLLIKVRSAVPGASSTFPCAALRLSSSVLKQI